MNQNIKIAKDLVKLARLLVSKEDEDEEEEYVKPITDIIKPADVVRLTKDHMEKVAKKLSVSINTDDVKWSGGYAKSTYYAPGESPEADADSIDAVVEGAPWEESLDEFVEEKILAKLNVSDDYGSNDFLAVPALKSALVDTIRKYEELDDIRSGNDLFSISGKLIKGDMITYDWHVSGGLQNIADRLTENWEPPGRDDY